MYTLRSPQWRKRTGAMLVYFAGLLAIGGVLESRSPIFMAFMITGFLQAFVVLPPVLAIFGVAATSCVLYLTQPGSNWLTPRALPFLIFIIGLQTLTVVAGYVGIKMSHENTKRRKLVTHLEAALEENAGLHVQLLTQAREAGVLDERQRLAREIHDTLAQGLTGIITQLEAAEQTHEQSIVWQRHVDQALSLARESLTRRGDQCRRCDRNRWRVRAWRTPSATWPRAGPKARPSRCVSRPPATRRHCSWIWKSRCFGSPRKR